MCIGCTETSKADKLISESKKSEDVVFDASAFSDFKSILSLLSILLSLIAIFKK